MSTELATIETVTTQIDPTGGRIEAWARAADSAHGLANALCKTTFVPEAMKDVGNATAAILMGDELGFTPLAALKSIYVIHGTPALYTRAMVALVLSRGHEIWTEESKNESVTVKGKRKGSEHIESSTWTIKRATDAGYVSNAKYRTNPQEMLYAKAAAEIARKIGADVLMGVPYSVEDLELEDSTTTTLQRNDPEAPKAIERKSNKKEAVVIPEPPLNGEDDDQEEPKPAQEQEESQQEASTPELATKAQIGLIGVLMKELGLIERDAAIAYVCDVVERQVQSRTELTKSEASKVIESLQADKSGGKE